jgi:hypothetical protein
MNRRSFIKGLIALASAPAIGKYVNVFKTEGARQGIEQVAGRGVDFFNNVIKKVMDEGTLVNESDRIQTFRHPDKPDLNVEVDLSTGNANVSFATDQGTEGIAAIEKDMEVSMSDPGELIDEGLEGGITNLEEFLKNKKRFAAGGRVGMFRGGIPKGLQAALQAIRSKFGKGAIHQADEVVIDGQTYKYDDPNRPATELEIETKYAEIDDPEAGLPGYTVKELDQALIDDKNYRQAMFVDYKAGRLDPKPGEKGREKFLEKKLEEAELSGKSKLITRDEIEELEDLKMTRELEETRKMVPKSIERLELKARYPGITDDLIDSILIDDNPQRKADVLATLDEVFVMMKKGKGPDEVLEIIKNMNRTKQADGGSVDGDVSLTVIKIPDISESGVESLFKRR